MENRTRRTALINQIREKRMQEQEPLSLRSHKAEKIKGILNQT